MSDTLCLIHSMLMKAHMQETCLVFLSKRQWAKHDIMSRVPCPERKQKNKQCNLQHNLTVNADDTDGTDSHAMPAFGR